MNFLVFKRVQYRQLMPFREELDGRKIPNPSPRNLLYFCFVIRTAVERNINILVYQNIIVLVKHSSVFDLDVNSKV